MPTPITAVRSRDCPPEDKPPWRPRASRGRPGRPRPPCFRDSRARTPRRRRPRPQAEPETTPLFDRLARRPGRHGVNEGCRLVGCFTVFGWKIAQLDDDCARSSVDKNVLALQTEGLKRMIVRNPPLIAIARPRSRSAAASCRLAHPIGMNDLASVCQSILKHHLPYAREVAECGVEAGAVELATHAWRAVHDEETVAFRAQRFPERCAA